VISFRHGVRDAQRSSSGVGLFRVSEDSPGERGGAWGAHTDKVHDDCVHNVRPSPWCSHCSHHQQLHQQLTTVRLTVPHTHSRVQQSSFTFTMHPVTCSQLHHPHNCSSLPADTTGWCTLRGVELLMSFLSSDPHSHPLTPTHPDLSQPSLTHPTAPQPLTHTRRALEHIV
jgi:hypothetical protein